MLRHTELLFQELYKFNSQIQFKYTSRLICCSTWVEHFDKKENLPEDKLSMTPYVLNLSTDASLSQNFSIPHYLDYLKVIGMGFRRFPRYDLKTTLRNSKDTTPENFQIEDLDSENWLWPSSPPLVPRVI